MNKIFYLTLLFFIPSIVFAQSNYKAGSIVDLKGDTIHGFIDYKEWVQNPESITFKPDQNGKSKQLGVDDIKYFGVTGYEYYRRYKVNISLNNMDIDQLTETPDTTTKTATVFLKIVQSGKNVTLFSYTDDLKERFYICDKINSQPAELIFLQYLNPDGSGVVSRKFYQGQLTVIAGNNHLSLSGDLSNTDYDEGSLTKIIIKINGAKSSLSVQNKQSSIRFFAGLAAGSTSLQFSGGGSDAVLSGSATSFSPEFTVGFDAYLNPNVRRLVIRAELSFSTASYNITNSSPGVSTAVTNITNEQLKQYDIGLSPMVIYNFYNTAALTVYAGAGIKLNFPFYPTNIYTASVDANGAITPLNTTDLANGKLSTASVYFSVPIKAGIVMSKNLDIYLAYYTQGTLTNYDATAGNVTTYQVGINYIFGK